MAMLSMGFIGWSLDSIAEGTTALSAAMHLTALGVGLLEARRAPIPRAAAFGAWGLWVALQPISYFLTDPALNVNVARAPWPPFARFVPSMLAYRGFNALLAIAFIAGARTFLRLAVERRQMSHQ